MTTNTNITDDLIADIDALRSPEGYLNAGIPNYNHLFGRDACVSALQLLDFDQEIAYSTLKSMARYQAKKRRRMNESYPGKMPHEHFPGGTKEVLLSSRTARDRLRRLYILALWRFPYYGTVDTGAWFIILLHRYFKKTGDEEFLYEMWPAAIGVILWLEKRATSPATGLIAYQRTYAFGLLNQSWKDTLNSSLKPPTAMVEVQGYYYEAYRCLAELAAQIFNNHRDSERFELCAQRLKESLNEHLWHKETSSFSLAVNAAGRHDTSIASNPGHLLFTGILSEQQAKSVIDRLMSDDMITPYGIRTLSTTEKAFDTASYQEGSVWPFDNWVFYQGLLKHGFVAEANIIKDGLLAAHHQLGNIPELYIVSLEHEISRYPESCIIQAWSTGALINMTTSQEPVL